MDQVSVCDTMPRGRIETRDGCFNPSATERNYVLSRAKDLIREAGMLGLVLTIERVSWPDLAMGNAFSCADVRPMRVPKGWVDAA